MRSECRFGGDDSNASHPQAGVLAAACGVERGATVVTEAAGASGCMPKWGARPTKHTLNAVLSACIDASRLWKGSGASSVQAVSLLVEGLVVSVGVDSVTHNLLLSRCVESPVPAPACFVCACVCSTPH